MTIIIHPSAVKRDAMIGQITIPEVFHFWIHRHIAEPIAGFEHKQNPDGSQYSRRQQIAATRLQAIAIVHDFLKRGKSDNEIFEMLYYFKS